MHIVAMCTFSCVECRKEGPKCLGARGTAFFMAKECATEAYISSACFYNNLEIKNIFARRGLLGARQGVCGRIRACGAARGVTAGRGAGCAGGFRGGEKMARRHAEDARTDWPSYYAGASGASGHRTCHAHSVTVTRQACQVRRTRQMRRAREAREGQALRRQLDRNWASASMAAPAPTHEETLSGRFRPMPAWQM